MAEIFGVASGALSVAGLAGQLAQSAAFLYDFVSDIRGAPKRVRALGEELRILKSILGNIQKSYTVQNADLEHALKHCQKRLNELLRFVKKVDPDQHAKKRRKLWSQFRVALKSSDLAKYLGELDRSKSMLLQACANVLRDEQTSHSNQLEAVGKSARDLSTKQRACNAATSAIQSTAEEIRDTSSNLFSNSARVVTVTNETHTKMNELSHNTEQIRAMIERIELTTQTLVQERLGHQPMILETLKGELNRTISRSLKLHLRQHFGPPKADQMQANNGDDMVRSIQHPKDTGTVSESRRCCPGNEDAIRSTIGLENPADKWVKKSSIESQRDLIRNTTFGTMSIRTTTVSYIRESVKGRSETKQLSTTTLAFLPAPWLMSQGAVLRYQRLEILSRGGSQNIPHWTLSTVNVIHADSEIFSACLRHDLGTIRKLFDAGCASPYDVDSEGRNLLGYVAVGVQFHQFLGKHESFQRRLDELDAIIALLIGLGIDPGCIDLDGGVPITIFALCWSDALSELPIISSQEDRFKFLLKKLLMSAKTDPFCGSDAYVVVAPNGGYRLYDFPGAVAPDEHEEISTLQLELLMGQKEWQITWAQTQLHELSSARWLYWSEHIQHVRTHVSFWVTSQAEDVKKYLYTKLGLIRRLLDYGLLYLEPGGDHCVIEALHTAIHQGGEVIALLTEHKYYDSGQEPWIRHRFRKLVVIERWLTEVIELLLTSGATHIADPEVVDSLCRHAQRHNARTLCAWIKALRACTEDRPRPSRQEMDTVVSETDGKTARSDDPEEQDTDKQWETEDTEGEGSEWETEEEQEEGYMFERAVDRECFDARNPQISNEERHTCYNGLQDYDETYWKHVYPHIIGSNMDTISPGHRESWLWRLARYAGDFIAPFV